MTTPPSPRKPAPVAYKGEPLDADRGPGLGCFWFQMIALATAIVLTPLTVSWNWPFWITAVLFVMVMLLLLLTGQTMIFLLRLVAAGRTEGRRRPLASGTPTVGEIEDEAPAAEAQTAQGTGEAEPRDHAVPEAPAVDAAAASGSIGPGDDDTDASAGNDPSGVRQ